MTANRKPDTTLLQAELTFLATRPDVQGDIRRFVTLVLDGWGLGARRDQAVHSVVPLVESALAPGPQRLLVTIVKEGGRLSVRVQGVSDSERTVLELP